MHSSFLLCEACDTPTYWPIWIRYEHLDYHPHCWRCYLQRAGDFTTELAILEALAIIAEPRIIRPRVKVGGK